jgi:transcriptional regulator GlxA family with amidase domain
MAPKNNRISAAVGYARDHINEALTLERLADAAGMSRPPVQPRIQSADRHDARACGGTPPR